MKINIREMSFETISTWPNSAKAILFSLVGIVILILAYLIDFRSKILDLRMAEQQQITLKQEYETKHHQAANLAAYRKQLVQMKKLFSIMLKELPESTEVPGLLDDISKIGVASGLEFSLFKPLPENPMDFYAELPIQISVNGDYHQFALFISRLAALDRIVTIHDFVIQPPTAMPGSNTTSTNTNNGPLQMDITAKTYRYAKEQGF